MEIVRCGSYVFQLGLYPDPDLSPANLGEAFDYYSAVPGWGWRAIAYHEGGRWQAGHAVFGATLGEADFALPGPEEETESYFPCGRAVALTGGGVAYEGGIALPPRSLPKLGDAVGVWLTLSVAEEALGAELRFTLQENESWDALEPSALAAAPRLGVTRRPRIWSPLDEPLRHATPPDLAYVEPPRFGLPEQLTDQAKATLAAAREEAHRLRQEHVGSEVLLLGLLRAGQGQAARALDAAGVGLPAARAAVEFLQTHSPGPATGGSQLLPSANKAMDLAADEARRLGATAVDADHLLLGLLRQNGPAVAVLEWLGVDYRALRARLSDKPRAPWRE